MINLAKQYLKKEDISNYRQLLMGIGIFGVLFSHWFGFQEINRGIPFTLSTLIVKLVFTEGFLFLSGFGLYYSFSSNSNVALFYRKRFLRVYVPFFLLSLPLYLFFLWRRNDYGIVDFIYQISTIYFWIKGNYGGMWYLSLSIMLYFLFPFIYLFLFKKKSQRSIIIKLFSLLVLVYAVIYYISANYVDYYENISIGIDKIVFFILGMAWGYVVKNDTISLRVYGCIVVLIGFVYLSLTIIRICGLYDSNLIKDICAVFQKLLLMPLICVFFNALKSSFLLGFISSSLNWFGRYSLELYILHLHFFMFFKYGLFKGNVPVLIDSSLAIFLAIVLCVPVSKVISNITNYFFLKKTKNIQ